MKTLTRYKSLLFAGGLLFIIFTGINLKRPQHNGILKAVTTEKRMISAKCDIRTDGGSYIKDIAEKLFPVLKNLNLM